MDDLARLIEELKQELTMTNEQKTIRVRIAVAVSAEGHYSTSGGTRPSGKPWSDESLLSDVRSELEAASPIATHFIEADIPLPVATTIEGKVTT